MPGEEPLLDLLLYHTPNFYIWVVRWYYVAPAAAVIVGGLFLTRSGGSGLRRWEAI